MALYRSVLILTILVGATAGTIPDFKMIRCPLSLATKETNPVESPLLGSELII
jgi:hypothetical protein